MKIFRAGSAIVLSLTAGLAYLLEAGFASFYLEPCTDLAAFGPVSTATCDVALVVLDLVWALAIVIVLFGLLILTLHRFSLVWGTIVIMASVGGYSGLLVLVFLTPYSPPLYAQFVFALLFLPALALGVLGGTAGRRWHPVGSTTSTLAKSNP